MAQPGPDGFDWVTVTNPGNPSYHGPDPEQLVTGRGSVDHDYRISRTEVTTAQWAEFYSTFYFRLPLGQRIPLPVFWGATLVGNQFVAPNETAAMMPVGGVSWRTCAKFCNWLHNNKSSDLSALETGAYDISTFGFDASGNFTDQAAHSPGARYWLPTLDEYLKASFWSPTNPNNDGWYMYPIGSDTPPIYGPPPGFPGGNSANQANAGFMLGQTGHWTIPLGSYPNATSPWGLLDVAGATSEWLEGIYIAGNRRYRVIDGSWAGTSIGNGADLVYIYGTDLPDRAFSEMGFRIASAVPACGPLTLLVVSSSLVIGRRARRPPARGAESCDCPSELSRRF